MKNTNTFSRQTATFLGKVGECMPVLSRQQMQYWIQHPHELKAVLGSALASAPDWEIWRAVKGVQLVSVGIVDLELTTCATREQVVASATRLGLTPCSSAEVREYLDVGMVGDNKVPQGKTWRVITDSPDNDLLLKGHEADRLAEEAEWSGEYTKPQSIHVDAWVFVLPRK